MRSEGLSARSSLFVLFLGSSLAACVGPAPVNNDGSADSAAEATASETGSDVALTDATLDALPEAAADSAPPTDALPEAAADAAPEAAADAAADAPADAAPSCVLRNVVATTTTGTTGGYVLGTVAARDLRVATPPMGAMIQQDHVVRQSGCILFDLWRTFSPGANQLVVLDPANPYTPRQTITLPAMSPGGDAAVDAVNPYDIAVLAPDRAYVVLYNLPRLLIVNPATGALRGSVDLSMFAGADGIPEAATINVTGGRAWVTLQQLDRPGGYTAPARSTLVAVDTATDTLADLDAATAGVQASVQLTFGNPGSTALSPDGRLLLVASVGNFGSNTDGGIDMVDTTTGRVLRSLPASTLGGDPSSVVFVSATEAWAALSRPAAGADAGSEYLLVSFNPTSGSVDTTPRVRSSSVQWGGLRLGPDGNVWALNTAFGANGTVGVFMPNGAPVGTPFTIASTGTYSLDFAP